MMMTKKWRISMFVVSSFFLLAACGKNEQKNSENQTTIEPKESQVVNDSSNIEENEKNQVSFDNYEYDYDVVTSATKTTFGTTPAAKMTYEEKLDKMFWSTQPPLGLIEGNYYRNERRFDGDYRGIVEVVTDDDSKILHVEFNEFASENYYEPKYAGKSKRLSDYAFFQAQNTRTDETLVTVVNGITFLEKQMREENRVDGAFETVKGSSTSARNGFMPIAAEMADWIRTPYKSYYYGYAEDFGNGIVGRLQVTTEDGKIDTVRYDEYFADKKESISEEKLQSLYRQSKYYSLDYQKISGDNFVAFSDQLGEEIIKSQNFEQLDERLMQHPSYENYQKIAKNIQLN